MRNQLTNDQLAALHYVRPDPLEPLPDTLVITEREHLFKSFVDRYQSSSMILKEKLLREVFYYFQDAMTMIYALENSSIIKLLLQESKSSSENLALLVIQSCELICRDRRGRVTFIQSDGHKVLKELFYISNESIRMHVYLCIEKLAADNELISVLYNTEFFTIVWQRLTKEPSDILLQILNRILGLFLLVDNITSKALEAKVEEVLEANTHKTDKEVIRLSVKNLLYITYQTQGKLRIVEKDIHVKVAKIYLASEVDNLTFIAFFGSIAQITAAKKAFIDMGLVDAALNFLSDDTNGDLVLNSVLLLTSLAEYGNLRQQLKMSLKTIERLRLHKDADLIAEYVEDLIQTINWTP